MKKSGWMVGLPGMCATALAEAEEPMAEAMDSARSVFAVPGGLILLAVVVALLAALIVLGSMKAKLKTAARQTHAGNYIREGSFNLLIQQDQLLYTTEQRRRVESDGEKK